MASLIVIIIAIAIVAACRKFAFRSTNVGELILDIGLVLLIAAVLSSC
jgi:hypothetical protein